MTILDIKLREDIFENILSYPSKYFNKTNFQMYLSAVCNELQTVNKDIYDLRFLTTIDQATGINLDYIGDLVGEPRKYSIDLLPGYFTIGDIGLNETGFGEGKFWSPNFDGSIDGNREDEAYRRAIKAKICINNSYGTPEDIIRITKIITSSTVVDYNEEYPGGIELLFNGEIDDTEIGIALTYIERALPVGVSLNLLQKMGEDNPLYEKPPTIYYVTDLDSNILTNEYGDIVIVENGEPITVLE